MLRYLKYLTHIAPLILLVRYLRHVNNSISIFDGRYWNCLKTVLMFFILILLKVLNYMNNDNKQCSVLNDKKSCF